MVSAASAASGSPDQLPVLLDTNIISKALRGKDATRSRLQVCDRSRIRVSSMVLAELEYAAMRSQDPIRHRRKWLSLLVDIPVLPFDSKACRWHAEIRQALRHRPIGERDLIIAATAMANDCLVVTNNLREFTRVPNLPCEDWSA